MKRGFVITLGIVSIGILVWSINQPASNTDSNGEAIVSVVVPGLTVEQQEGEALFNSNCASCHGRNAAGQADVAPPLIHKTYEPSHHGDIAFQRAAQYGVRAHHWPFGNMPPVETVSKSDVTTIIAYVRALQRANGIN